MGNNVLMKNIQLGACAVLFFAASLLWDCYTFCPTNKLTKLFLTEIIEIAATGWHILKLCTCF